MCPFKKAFPLVLFLHLIFAVGIFASFAEHRSAEHLFTLLPALGVGEELHAGKTSVPASPPQKVLQPLAETSPAPQVTPIMEAKEPEVSPAPVAAVSKTLPVTPMPLSPQKTTNAVLPQPFAPRGSIAGDTESKMARVGGSMATDDNMSGTLTPPIALKKQRPVHVGEKGEVVLNFTINERGCVENVSVEASPSAQMTEAVMAVLPKWRFTPAKADGKIISMRVRQVVRF